MLLPAHLKGFTYHNEERNCFCVAGTAKKIPSTYHIMAQVPLAGAVADTDTFA